MAAAAAVQRQARVAQSIATQLTHTTTATALRIEDLIGLFGAYTCDPSSGKGCIGNAPDDSGAYTAAKADCKAKIGATSPQVHELVTKGTHGNGKVVDKTELKKPATFTMGTGTAVKTETKGCPLKQQMISTEHTGGLTTNEKVTLNGLWTVTMAKNDATSEVAWTAGFDGTLQEVETKWASLREATKTGPGAVERLCARATDRLCNEAPTDEAKRRAAHAITHATGRRAGTDRRQSDQEQGDDTHGEKHTLEGRAANTRPSQPKSNSKRSAELGEVEPGRAAQSKGHAPRLTALAAVAVLVATRRA
ncbi:hypothetical protein TRVL_05510 [Trypanosoma vivax]|nr:hypothetical protein TRVL_05510 [Trypanosoma vivax]